MHIPHAAASQVSPAQTPCPVHHCTPHYWYDMQDTMFKQRLTKARAIRAATSVHHPGRNHTATLHPTISARRDMALATNCPSAPSRRAVASQQDAKRYMRSPSLGPQHHNSVYRKGNRGRPGEQARYPMRLQAPSQQSNLHIRMSTMSYLDAVACCRYARLLAILQTTLRIPFKVGGSPPRQRARGCSNNPDHPSSYAKGSDMAARARGAAHRYVWQAHGP